MRMPALLVAGMLVPGLALACPGADKTAQASDKAEVTLASLDASACAKKAELVGAACSYSTGMMASRVLEEGKSFTYTGSLTPTAEKLSSKVAAPFQVGPENVRVIANQVVETAETDQRKVWQGKLLEVEGVKYFVVTSFEKASA